MLAWARQAMCGRVRAVWAGAWMTLLHLQLSEAVCSQYFNIPSTNNPSALGGRWVTMASTRRLMPCHSLQGFLQTDTSVRVEEWWRQTGVMAQVWDYNVTSTVTVRDGQLSVTQYGLDGLLTGGPVKVGVLDDKLLLVQCNPIFLVPVPAITILARKMPANPAEEVPAVLDYFQVPKTSQDITLVKQEGCDLLATNPAPSVLTTRLADGDIGFFAGLQPAAPQTRTWNIIDSPDGNGLP
ncbi:uncharacterized protein [Procambarus clarkii]|uniref:uncharacterized protein n=1 Tax=Procambarus clarkii TaxID=6728 RepID=UPI001E6732A5|nr:uncharacterized protein LOC123760581 [Procambarus clarkii]